MSEKTIIGGDRSDGVLKLRPIIPVLFDEGCYAGVRRSGKHKILRIYDRQAIHELGAGCIGLVVRDQPLRW